MKNQKNLFQKVACFTDIHFGLRNNSHLHNDDCLNFVKWFIKIAKEKKCETCIFLGDWHHNRASINVSTMNYSLKALILLNDAFEKIYFINGNHDLYYRDTRELNSIEYNKLLPNFVQINEPFVKDNVAIIPWLIQDEWKKISKIKCKYMFGHFELPDFYMNAQIKMPKHHKGINKNELSNPDFVFSGHFHKRQANKNIIYIGNCFPHNYSDIWDTDRGMMFLEWNKDPEFFTWPDQPTYKIIELSVLLNNPTEYLEEKCNLRIQVDTPITYEEGNFIKNLFTQHYKLREFVLVPYKKNNTDTEKSIDNILQFKNINEIIITHLQDIKSDTFNNDTLISIYNKL